MAKTWQWQPVLLVLASLIGVTSPLDGFQVSSVPFLRNPAAIVGLVFIAVFVAARRGRLRLTTRAQRWAIGFLTVIMLMEFGRVALSDFVDFTGDADVFRVFLLFMTWAQLILLFLLLVDVARDPRSLQYTLFGLIGTVCAFAIGVILKVPGIAMTAESGRLSPFGMNANEAGFLFSLGFTAMLWWVLYRSDRTIIALAGGGTLTVALVVSLILTGSRGSTLATAVGVLALVVLSLNMQRVAVYLIAIPAALFIVVVFGIDAYFVDLARPLTDRFVGAIEGTSRGARDVIWAASWELFLDKPFLGHGLQASHAIGDILRGGRPLAAHNSFFTLALAFGLVGFFLWTVIFFSVLRSVWKVRWHSVGVLFLALFAVIVVSSLFGDNVRSKYFWIILALGAQAPYWIRTYPGFFQEYGRTTRSTARRYAMTSGTSVPFRGRL